MITGNMSDFCIVDFLYRGMAGLSHTAKITTVLHPSLPLVGGQRCGIPVKYVYNFTVVFIYLSALQENPNITGNVRI